jgi:hypothetical protein
MLRAVLLAALLAPTAAAAQGLFRFEYDVRRADPAADPALTGHLSCEAGSLYGGLRAELLPGEHYDPAFGLYLGLHPSIRRTTLDLDLAYRLDARAGDAGTVALGLSRPLGARASLGAGFRLDSGAGVTRTEVRAAYDLSETLRIDAALGRSVALDDPAHAARHVLDAGAARALSATSSLTLRFRDASDTPACTEFGYRLAF